MTITNNPKLVPGFTPQAAGALYLDRQVTDLADPVAFPAAFALADQIQIGVIPAGCVLVPELSTVQLPIIDTGTTGKASIGTAASPAAICAQQALTAALVLRGSSFSASPKPNGTVPLGLPDDDVPIYLTATAAVTTLATSGQIVADLVFRAFVPGSDPVSP